MKHIETEQIAEISYSRISYTKGWCFYVVDGQGERLSDLELDKRGKLVPAINARFETKAEAVAELKKQFPAALVLNKSAFQQEHSLRSYRGDNS